MWLIGKDDAVQMAEVNTGGTVMAGFVRFPGVEDHGMHDTTMTRQPGRLYVRFHGWETARTTERRKNGSTGHGDSDRLIVSLMAGNAAGEKETTHGRAKSGHIDRAQ